MNDIRTTSRLLLLTYFMLISPFVLSEELKVDNLLLNGFKSNEPDLQWYVQNDTVMGGRSEGGFSIVDEELLFSGVTNTNGGGFSSIRTQRFIKDLSGYSGVKLRVKGRWSKVHVVNTNRRSMARKTGKLLGGLQDHCRRVRRDLHSVYRVRSSIPWV